MPRMKKGFFKNILLKFAPAAVRKLKWSNIKGTAAITRDRKEVDEKVSPGSTNSAPPAGKSIAFGYHTGECSSINP